MPRILRRVPFDRTFFILFPAVLLTYFVPIRMRVGNMMLIPFIVLWLFVVFLQRRKADATLGLAFFKFIVPMAIFYLMRGFLFGYKEWDMLPLSRHYLYAGIVMFYMYLFHYCVSRRCYRELFVLNMIIVFSLAYGSISYLSYDMGSFRNQVKVNGIETLEQTYDRLERASAGLTNYGDAYAMLFVALALLAYLKSVPVKWKAFYVGIIGLFCLGIYQASYSTATALLLMSACCVWLFRLCRVSVRRLGWLLAIISILFVVTVAHPKFLSPFAGLVNGFGFMMEAISPDYALRLHSVAEAMAGYKDTYAVMRGELYWNSLDIFVHNPIFGFRWDQILFNARMNLRTLGHSYLFDSFGAGGLSLGLFLLIGMVNYYRYLKLVYRRAGFSPEFLRGWLHAFWALFIVSCINQINLFELQIGFFFLVPSIPFYHYAHHVEACRHGWPPPYMPYARMPYGGRLP